MDRSRRAALAALPLLPLLLSAPRLRADEPPRDGEKKPFSEVVAVPDRELTPLFGTPIIPGLRAGPPNGGGCYTQQCNQNIYCFPGSASICLLQSFQEVQWRICIYATPTKGLAVGPVDMKRNSFAPWRRLIYKAGQAEIFTPYHTTLSDRIYDTQWGNPNSLVEVQIEDAGPNGVIIPLSGQGVPKVVAECRDRGITWLCKGSVVKDRRRGQELALWGVYDTGNYELHPGVRLPRRRLDVLPHRGHRLQPPGAPRGGAHAQRPVAGRHGPQRAGRRHPAQGRSHGAGSPLPQL